MAKARLTSSGNVKLTVSPLQAQIIYELACSVENERRNVETYKALRDFREALVTVPEVNWNRQRFSGLIDAVKEPR